MEAMRLGPGPHVGECDDPVEPDTASEQVRSAVPAGPPAPELPPRIADRYQLRAEIGRGGMAVVYRVHDLQSGRELALKQLLLQEAGALFEREFRTLTQLSHPRVIEVYDFGVDEGRSYYTMELLDGGDLRERCPVPWADACRWMFDVCSSLALLHSRRLVHRDITPRNVRCTQSGAAKLIDFGALVPMGAGGKVVGTPAFVAPEVLHRSQVDGRADLYSLGSTLYYALTGQPPYPAHDFVDLSEAWRSKPPPPSHVNAQIPTALDALVMSLLSLEPAQRPRSAYDVMQRLSALAGIADVEALNVSRAYLTTPVLVGRERALDVVRRELASAHEGSPRVVRISAEPGIGRSRMLDAVVLEAKTLGATVLRASGGAAADQPLLAAHALLEQTAVLGERAIACASDLPNVLPALFEAGAHPLAVRSLGALQGSAAEAIEAGCALWLALARKQLRVIALDDAHAIDDVSCSLLATLLDRAQHARILLALTVERDAPPRRGLQLLARECTEIELEALDEEHTGELLGSLFGDVPNVPLVSNRIFKVARGKPRETMELAQHLVDRGAITYQGGGWVLPAQLDAHKLPNSAAQSLVERVAELSPLARFIAEAQSLAMHPAFTRDDYALLCDGWSRAQVDAALDELLVQQVLRGDGRLHVLAHGTRSAALTAHLAPEAIVERQRALAGLYAQRPERLAKVHHAFAGEQPARALDLLMAELAGVDDERAGLFQLADIDADQLASVFEHALDAAEKLGRPARERCELLRYLTSIGVVADEGVYQRAAPRWLARLERDSGLAFYRADVDGGDPAARLQRAYAHASEQHAAAPAHEQAYAPHEAIRLLVHYVVVSIALGSRTRDGRLLASLPEVLEPFVALSPLIEAMRENAIATWEVNCGCQLERALERVTGLYERLADVSGSDLHNARTIRNALAYCAGAIEAAMGRSSAMKWADVLDKDSLQLVNAMHIRKIVALQRGDAEGSEAFRRQADLLAARATWRQMFAGTALTELGAYARAHDITGVKRALTEIERYAERCPGWVASRHLAEAHLQRLRGDMAAARDAYLRCVALASPDPAEPWRTIHAWPGAVAGYMQVLLELGACEQTVSCGEQALELAAARGLVTATHEITRVLALAEARLGHYERACERLSALIETQQQLEISGLWLGASYETRARIAIAAGDSDAVERYSLLTAREYRHGHGSALGALYERLIEDARKAGVRVLPQLSQFETRILTSGHTRGSSEARAMHVLRRARDRGERAARALELICDARGVRAGHLYLVDESGLVLVAAHGGLEADPCLLEHAVGFMREQLREQPELATEPLTGSESSPSSARVEDARGHGYLPVLLRCVVDGTPRCAGVALLALDAAQAPPSQAAFDLLAVIGSLLIQAGNTAGMLTRA